MLLNVLKTDEFAYSIVWSICFPVLTVIAFALLVRDFMRTKKQCVGIKRKLACLFVIGFAATKSIKYIWRSTGTFIPHHPLAQILFSFPEGFLCSCFSLLLFHWSQLFKNIAGGPFSKILQAFLLVRFILLYES